MLELIENEKLNTRGRKFEIREEFKNAHPEIAEKLMSDEYSFLWENEHLGDKISLLTLGGSHAYGLNTEASDTDIRGVAINTEAEILGTSNFEQFINKDTDTTIYGMKKFINLMTQCNPNILEMLSCRPEDYIYISPVGQMLLDNKDVFLSQRAAGTFGGYARAQIKRIENATARDRLSNLKRQEHIASGAQSALDNLSIQHELDKYGETKIYVDEESETLLMDCSYSQLPVGEWVDQMNTVKQVLLNYEHTMGINKKKDDLHLNKHASHIIRLLNMGIEILRDKTVNTYRSDDRDFLMDIKNGKYMNEEGLFTEEFWDEVHELDEELSYWKEHTDLPKSPDLKKIENLLIEINKLSLKQEN